MVRVRPAAAPCKATAQADQRVRDLAGAFHALHDDDGVDAEDLGLDVVHDNGREAPRVFVEQDQSGMGHQCAADGHHLLLAARQ